MSEVVWFYCPFCHTGLRAGEKCGCVGTPEPPASSPETATASGPQTVARLRAAAEVCRHEAVLASIEEHRYNQLSAYVHTPPEQAMRAAVASGVHKERGAALMLAALACEEAAARREYFTANAQWDVQEPDFAREAREASRAAELSLDAALGADGGGA